MLETRDGLTKATTPEMRFELRINVAGEIWLLTGPEKWRGRFCVVFRHIEVLERLDPVVRVDFYDRLPESRSDIASLLRFLEDDRSVIASEAGGQVIHVSKYSYHRFDLEKGLGEVVLLDAAYEMDLLGTNLLLRHIAWRSARRGYVPLHAAAIGSQGSYWLLPAGSGKGKSTLAAAAHLLGLSVLGDDFVLWDPVSDRLFSLYRTIRLDDSSVRLLAEQFADCRLEVVERRKDDKTIFVPSLGRMEGDVNFGTLLGVVDLERGDRYREASPLDSAKAMSAFASTFLMLPALGVSPRACFREVSRLVKRLPCFRVYSTKSLERAVLDIEQLTVHEV